MNVERRRGMSPWELEHAALLFCRGVAILAALAVMVGALV